MKLLFVSAVCLTVWLKAQVSSQVNSLADDTAVVTDGLAAFTIELLAKTAVEAGNQINIIIATYSVWKLLAILNEGAAGTTANQLQAVLRIPSDNARYKFGYKNINRILTTNTSGIEINLASAIFTDRNKQISKNFMYQTTSQYDVSFFPVNFADVQKTADFIDAFIAKATNNRLEHFINFEDIASAQLLLTTVIFFKGQWTIPFNKSATKLETFYDENMQAIGRVQMMYQSADYAYSRLDDLQAHAVAIPYGPEEKYWMVIVMPIQGVRLNDFLTRLTRVPFKSIIHKLVEEKEKFAGDEVVVYLPKFKITSDFVLNIILEKMGLIDVFDPYYANLLKISNDNLYLSRVIHKAEIEVNEEGTVASGATGGTIYDKMISPEFKANRPFAYFIVEKTTDTVLFAGKLSNPNDIN